MLRKVSCFAVICSLIWKQIDNSFKQFFPGVIDELVAELNEEKKQTEELSQKVTNMRDMLIKIQQVKNAKHNTPYLKGMNIRGVSATSGASGVTKANKGISQ